MSESERCRAPLMTGLERPAPTRRPTAEAFGGAGGEIVHARRKRRGYVNPLVPGSSPGGPTNNRMTTVVTAIG